MDNTPADVRMWYWLRPKHSDTTPKMTLSPALVLYLKPTLKPTQLLMLSDRSGVEMPVATNEELQLLSDWKPHNSLDDESSHVSSRKRRRLVHLLSEELQSGYMPGVMRTLYAKLC